MMNRLKKVFCLFLTVFTLFSCQDKGSPYFEYVPFKREHRDLWGMIGLDGKILFENKYLSCPSPVYNGVFMLAGNDGYEFYTAEEEPEKVAGPYKRACPFTDVVTPVVTQEGVMQIIDRKGKVIRILDEVDGKKIETLHSFRHGKASFRTGDGWGVMNMDGEVCVPPVYRFALDVLDNGFLMGVKGGPQEGYTTVIFNHDGEVVDSLKGTFNPDISNGTYLVTDGYFSNAIVDVHGKVVIPEKESRTVNDQFDNLFVLREAGAFSLIRAEGDTLLKSDYSTMQIVDKDRLLLGLRGEGVVLADFSGKVLSRPLFDVNRMSRYYNGKVMPVRRNGDFRWMFIDKDGIPISRDAYKELNFYNDRNGKATFSVSL